MNIRQKTANSIRYIALPSETISELKAYQLEQRKEFLKNGAPYNNKGFVFTQYGRKPFHPDSVTNFLTKFSKKYDLPHINTHAFSHTTFK